MTTNMKNPNPLEGYLRTPKLYVVLPSQGKFSEMDTQSDITGEIPIFPMTAKDETMLRNPDALLNGESLVTVIQSVTGIQDVYNLSSNDIDVILLAARYATYGQILEVNATCPECNSDFESPVNIEEILETVVTLNDQYVVTLENGLQVYIRPYTFRDAQRAALQAFRETNELNKLTADDDTDELVKLASFNKSFQAMADLNITILSNSIIKIIIPAVDDVEEQIVTDSDHIHSWVNGIGKGDADAILDEANKINDEGIKREITFKCPDETCGHTFNERLEFNPSSFFDLGS